MDSVVVIALMAVLAGAAGPTAITRWAALKEESLMEAPDLPMVGFHALQVLAIAYDAPSAVLRPRSRGVATG